MRCGSNRSHGFAASLAHGLVVGLAHGLVVGLAHSLVVGLVHYWVLGLVHGFFVSRFNWVPPSFRSLSLSLDQKNLSLSSIVVQIPTYVIF